MHKPTVKSSGVKVRTTVKAGDIKWNHNPATSKGVRVKSAVKAGREHVLLARQVQVPA